MVEKDNELMVGSELIGFFADIEDSIKGLYRCSNDDFLMLSHFMKDCHKKSRTISGNANQIFDIIGGELSDRLTQGLNSIEASLERLFSDVSFNLDEKVAYLEKVHFDLNTSELAIKNLTQNIMTYKFLQTYVTIGVQENDSETKTQLSRFHKEYFKTFKNGMGRLSREVTGLKRKMEKVVFETRNFQFQNRKFLQVVLKDLEACCQIIKSNHEEASCHLPELTSRTKGSSARMADIITYLQYHDIIRQKIEHVQQSYAEIINDLKKLESNEVIDTASEGFPELFQKVCDISHLQSTQLVYINKEYQNAIDIITRSFQEIGDDLRVISRICSYFLNYYSADKNDIFGQLIENLEQCQKHISVFTEFQDHNNELLKDVEEGVKNINEMYQALDAETSEFFAENGLPLLLRKIEVPDLTRDQIDEHLLPLLDEMKQSNENVRRSLADAAGLTQVASLEKSTIIEQTSKDIIGQQELLQNNRETLNKIFEENQGLSEGILNEINRSIDKVNYYSFFNREIKKIILNLNIINRKLNAGAPKGERKSNLQQAKKHYTTHGERLIHQQVEKREDLNDGNIFSVKMQQPDLDDDNIELF